MASTSRIPVLVSASSSMPIIRTTASSTSPSLLSSSRTHHLSIATSSNVMAESDSDDQIWGKIEKLRTRRIYSEASSDFANSPASSSEVSTVGNSPLLGSATSKPLNGKISAVDSLHHESSGPKTNGTTLRESSSGLARSTQPGVTDPRISPARSYHVAIPPIDPLNSTVAESSTPKPRKRTPKPRPVAIHLSAFSLDSSSPRPGLGTSPDWDSEASRSTYGVGGADENTEEHVERGMQALGFEVAVKKDTFAGHLVVSPQSCEQEAVNDRKASTGTAGTASSTGADGGLPKRLRHVLGTESDRELAKVRAKGDASPDEADARMAPRRQAVDIPSVVPSSADMVTSAPISTSARTAAFVNRITNNPPDMPIMLDTDQSESDHSVQRVHVPNPPMTTAERRLQPNLRLSSMPDVPFLLASAVRHPARSPSGLTPSIPAKNPRRQQSSAARTPGSLASTPGLSGRPSPNSFYATPAETPAVGILDRTLLASPSQSERLVSKSSSPEFQRKEARSPRSSQLPISPARRAGNLPRSSPTRPEKSPTTNQARTVRNKGLTTAEIVNAMEYAEDPLQQQQSRSSDISIAAPSRSLPNTPLDHSPATSTVPAGICRLEDTRESFPNPASNIRSYMPKSGSSKNVTSHATKPLPRSPSETSAEPSNSEQTAKYRPLTIDVIHPASNSDQLGLPFAFRSGISHSPSSPGLGGLLATTPTRMSKRAHLIQEIWETERMYANDLALVRDAFLYRLRPTSQHSTSSAGATKTGGLSPDSRRSAFTFETAGTNATSFDSAVRTRDEDDEKAGFASSAIPLQRSPVGLRLSSSTSLNRSSRSIANEKGKDSRKAIDIMAEADVKAIFLNLEQLAAFSDDLAMSFENAIGDGTGREPIITENAAAEEIIVDGLGAVFQNAIPQIRSLYTFYCSRQAQANTRLSEIMSDPAQAAPLRECWETIQPFTHSWDLASMLIKPVQRIMKYPMLFNELLAVSTPAHPDYFHLKQAASSASAVADEINEVKRRKDLVGQAISNGNGKNSMTISPTITTNTINKENKLSFKLAKRFGKNKEKDREKTSPVVGTFSHLNISPLVDAELTSLIKQLESKDICIVRIGEEIANFPEVMRQYWVSQLSVAAAWHETYTLDPSDMIDRRMQVYRNMVELILKYPYVNLNKDVKYKVMPVMDILLNINRNPKAVIARMASKKVAFVKVLGARHRNDLKNIDKETMQNAEDYVSLHAQLHEELPAFLEGVCKLMNIVLGAFAIAQKDYYNGMQAHVRKFFFTVKLPVWGSEVERHDRRAKRPETGPDSVPGGESITRMWQDAWKPEQETLESLKLITGSHIRPLGNRAKSHEQMDRLFEPFSRIPSQRATTPQTGSFARKMSQTLLRPQLSREPSVVRESSKASRTRSSSLLGPATNDDSPQASGSGASSPYHYRPLMKHSRAQSTSSVHLSASAASSSRAPSVRILPSPSPHHRLDSDPASSRDSRLTVVRSEPDRNCPVSYLPPLIRTESIRLPGIQQDSVPPPPQYKSRDGKINASIPAVTSWLNARPLYQCISVAEFRVFERIEYSGLPFLTLAEGDIIDILYEVGRVDDFADLPIDVGVADDGLLVARDARKRIGLILCSFLEPLTRT
ncbi:hypothetical protein QFC22_001910 [Naganishia vaughanmartiniae]|uniref:Uncharacterized protein n=1 Tax=Naganishia vaughanmartiniae TaxID=1424756 RepID=A0ACC2XEY9_9TREE|nr:hypothetical protein QFC22_001910 [Naganishia vaughanmartiniae]